MRPKNRHLGKGIYFQRTKGGQYRGKEKAKLFVTNNLACFIGDPGEARTLDPMPKIDTVRHLL